MRIIHRYLSYRAEEGDRRLSGGIHITEKEIDQRGTAHRSRMEGIEHRPAIGQVTFDGQRTTGHHRGNHGLASRLQGDEQFALRTDQVQVGQAVRLAGKDSFFSQEHQHHIGAAGRCHDIVETRAPFPAVAIWHIVHLAGETLLQRLERRHRMGLLAIKTPGTQLVMRSIGHRAGNQNGADLSGLERKDPVVFQQDRRFFGRTACRIQMAFRILHSLSGIHIHIRMLKQAQQQFDAEDAADCLVDGRFLHLAAGHQFFQMGDETEGHHIHVDTGIHGLAGHVLAVGTEAVGNHLAHRVPVGYHQPVETPFVPEHILQDKSIACGRHAVVVVERSHQCQGAGLDGRFKRRQVDVAQLALRQEGAVVVTATLRRTIAHKMLDAGCQRICIQGLSLIAAYHGLRHAGIQIDILPATLCHAAPTRVAGNVEHGRERPADALPGSLHRGDTGALLHQSRIERRRQAQRNREDRMETVDHVATNQQRNAEAGFFHADALKFIDFDRIHFVQDGTDLTVAQRFGIVGHFAAGRHLVHLSDLLGQGHPRQQLFDAFFNAGIGTHR